MSLCSTHHAQLLTAIFARGLNRLIRPKDAPTPQDDDDSAPEAPPDPLVLADTAIWGNAVRVHGLYAMAPRLNGDNWCPLCHTNAPDWIDAAVENVVRVYQRDWPELLPGFTGTVRVG